MNKYNNIPLNCFNTLITDKVKFDTLFKIEVEEPVCESRVVYVDPAVWYYGLEGKQLSCMSYYFYQWNKMFFELGLSVDQMIAINDQNSTLCNFAHRRGWRGGEEHAKSMAILYPVK